MADKRFYKDSGNHSIEELAAICHAEVKANHTVLLKDIASLSQAESGDLTFYHNTKYKDDLQTTKASACLIHPDHIDHAPASLPLILTQKPYRAYAKIARQFYPAPAVEAHLSDLACIHPNAIIGFGVTIGPFCVIKDGVEIGNHTVIEAHTVVESGVVIGENCHISSNVTISHTLMGNNVLVKPGARIGQKGFGFEMDESGHIDVPQLGRVLIQDNVEIGSNTTIDRGAGPDTIIGKGSRIDNLVQIAHNVVLGENCVIVAQVGIAGSTRLGRFVIAAGQVGIAGHISIGDGVKIAAQSGIMRDIQPGETVAGSPAVSVRDWHKQTVALARLIKSKGKQK